MARPRAPARHWLHAAVLALSIGVGWPWASDQLLMQQAAQRLGPRAVAALPALQAVLQQAAALDEEAQLAAVNTFYNRRVVFRDDAEVWGQPDYWASPLETLDQGRGDCEDFAIAKYFTLIALGMPQARLRMVYVRAQLGGDSQAHMVLAYYAQPDAEPLILDNLIGSVRPASRRPDLTPVFSFNGEGLWQGVGRQSAGDPQARLSRWREVLAKARAEGFYR
ncbi:MAG TPA: transglutaminase-like cysteine peptidase [Burkholderiaceae bacterium]|nr:transglutaminase-like cysteine peptidase [Burkholderiaceae bacterium]